MRYVAECLNKFCAGIRFSQRIAFSAAATFRAAARRALHCLDVSFHARTRPGLSAGGALPQFRFERFQSGVRARISSISTPMPSHPSASKTVRKTCVVTACSLVCAMNIRLNP